MTQITSNGRFGICNNFSDFTDINPYNISGAFIVYVNNDNKICYTILTSTTSTSSVTPTMSDIPGLNEFPTDTDTGMPGISIYTDNSDQSKALNSKVYNGAKQWYSSLLDTGYDPVNGYVVMRIDTLIMDNVIISQYDGRYSQYSIKIDNNYNDYIILKGNNGSEILKIFSDGSVSVTSTIAPDTTTTETTTTETTTTPEPDTTTSTTTEETTTTPAPIKVEPTGLVNSPFTPTHTELPYVILYTEDDNEEHRKYNEALYENIMIDHNNHYNIEKNCLIINDRIIPSSTRDYLVEFTLHVDFENKCIYVHGHDYAEIGILNDNYVFELTDEVINLEYLESLNIFDHSTIGQNSTPTPNTTTSPNSTVTVTATYNPDSTTPTTTEYVTTPTTTDLLTTPTTTSHSTTLTTTELVTTPTTTSSTATVTVTYNPDTTTPITTGYSTTLTTTELVTTPTTTSSTATVTVTYLPGYNVLYQGDIDLSNGLILCIDYDCENTLEGYANRVPGDTTVVDTTYLNKGDAIIGVHYVSLNAQNEKGFSIYGGHNETLSPLMNAYINCNNGNVDVTDWTGSIEYSFCGCGGANIIIKECVDATSTAVPHTTPTTTSHSTTLTTTEEVTTPTTTSSTATITITPTITLIQEDIPICVNVHFNGNNYVYEDNIDDRFFVYGNRFSLTFDKYRPYSYESFDITHDDSLTNVTIGTAVDGVYIGCLYLSGDICRASNMHNIYININTATTTANKDEIDDSIDDIAPR